MPYYGDLKKSDPADRRTAEGLLRLKVALDKEIPAKTFDRKLLIATWNIRELGSRKYGARDSECLHYIAEIIHHFDLVAVQEVRDNLDEFQAIMRLLGAWWKPLFTDVTEGAQGNNERTAFLYDSRKLSFKGLAGEITLPPVKKGKVYEPVLQISRSPFLTGFQAGWFKFTICTTHLYYGLAKADDPQRLREMTVLSEFLAARVAEKTAFAKNMILLGDFNIFRNDGDNADETFKVLGKNGFKVPAGVQQVTSNAAGGKHYDQIAFIAPAVDDQLAESRSGAFNFFAHVYRPEDEAVYNPAVPEKTSYKEWRTYRMSDHLPLWVELDIDFSDEYLQGKLST